jgi:hypothetical protein
VIRRDPLFQNDFSRDQQRLGIEITAPVDIDERGRHHGFGGARRAAAEAGDRNVERAAAQRPRLGEFAIAQP